MIRKGISFATGLVMLFAFGGCSADNSESWQRGKRYVWIPPRTGSNVGRWVAKDDGESHPKARGADKKRRQEKRAEAKKEKAKARTPETGPERESSPPERFR